MWNHAAVSLFSFWLVEVRFALLLQQTSVYNTLTHTQMISCLLILTKQKGTLSKRRCVNVRTYLRWYGVTHKHKHQQTHSITQIWGTRVATRQSSRAHTICWKMMKKKRVCVCVWKKWRSSSSSSNSSKNFFSICVWVCACVICVCVEMWVFVPKNTKLKWQITVHRAKRKALENTIHNTIHNIIDRNSTQSVSSEQANQKKNKYKKNTLSKRRRKKTSTQLKTN